MDEAQGLPEGITVGEWLDKLRAGTRDGGITMRELPLQAEDLEQTKISVLLPA